MKDLKNLFGLAARQTCVPFKDNGNSQGYRKLKQMEE
jgi:hypothetical protein